MPTTLPLHVRILISHHKAKLFLLSILGEFFASIRCYSLLSLLNNNPPRPGDRTITEKWLQRMLKSLRMIKKGDSIASIELVPVPNNKGLSGSIKSVKVNVRNFYGSLETKNLILKMSHTGRNNRQSVMNNNRNREGKFYQKTDVFPICGFSCPKVVYSYKSDFFGEYVVLMEDLWRENSVGLNMVLSDKAPDVPGLFRSFADPLQALKLTCLKAAALHAKYWNEKSLLKQSWLKNVDIYQNRGRVEWEISIQKARNSWRNATKRIEDGNFQIKIDSNLRNVIEKTMTYTDWESMQNHLKNVSVPFTLCHGDFHASNFIYFPGNGGEVGAKEEIYALDWSEVGVWEGVYDLAQMFISDISPQLFVKYGKEIVKCYWDELVENGIEKAAYPFEQCWESFCRGGMERWVWLFAVLSGMENFPETTMQFFHDQLLAFYNEFGGNRSHFQMKLVVHVM